MQVKTVNLIFVSIQLEGHDRVLTGVSYQGLSVFAVWKMCSCRRTSYTWCLNSFRWISRNTWTRYQAASSWTPCLQRFVLYHRLRLWFWVTGMSGLSEIVFRLQLKSPHLMQTCQLLRFRRICYNLAAHNTPLRLCCK